MKLRKPPVFELVAATVHWAGTGVVTDEFHGCTAPKAPLCKGGCHANSVTGGLFREKWVIMD